MAVRAGIAAASVVGVVGLFLLTSTGAAPIPGPTSLTAPADLVAPEVPGLLSPAPEAAPVQPAPAAAPDAVAPVVGALFDSAAGSFDQHFDNGGGDGLVEGGGRPRFVDNPAVPGRRALAFALPGGGKRSEVLPEGPGTKPRDGDVQFVRYSAILGEDFPTTTPTWQLILQWHHDSPSGSPPLALQVTRGQLVMVSEGEDMRAIGPISPGQPIDLTMRIVFSRNPAQSSVTVWRDGRSSGVTDWSPRAGTMSTERAYLKMGMYRDPNIRQAGSMVVTDLKIGPDQRSIGGVGPRPLTAP